MSYILTWKRLTVVMTSILSVVLAAFASGVVSQAAGIDSIFTSTAPQTYFGPLFTRADGFVDPAAKVSDAVRAGTSKANKAEVVILLADQADVSAANDIKDWDERGWYVYNTLTTHAAATQADLRSFLDLEGVKYQTFWAANMIVATADESLVQRLAERPDVAKLESNRATRWIEPAEIADLRDATRGEDEPTAVEAGLTNVKAPDLWALGFTGQGMVIGELDTGVRWTHNSLKAKYRGWNGAAADHNFNWWDSVHTGGGTCGANTQAPCDDQGHGTHTAATTIGDDGTGNQVGVAPGAKWIGCRNMNVGNGTPATYTECFQFMIAPTDLTGNNANPGLRPHVLNNSWGCPPSEGCAAGTLETIVNNVQNAGIFVVVSAGNAGPGCSTVADPPALYSASFSVGAHSGTTNTIASFSSRGPSTFYSPNLLKPNISAPGVGVRSATRTSDTSFGSMSGTSMAGPHVAGVVALLWSARPALLGDIAATKALLQNTANPMVSVTATQPFCGGTAPTTIPNNYFGYGRVDVLAAYNAAGGATPTPTNTPTATPTNTPTATPTNTPTATPTNTPTATPTNTPTATPTNTPTATPTNTPTATPTNTPTATPTATPMTLPTFSVNSVFVVEPQCGTVAAVFTITKSGDNGSVSSVRVSTSDGTATVVASDYVPVTNLLVSFPVGTITQQVTVTVLGDTMGEMDEFFFLNLHDPINASISTPQGVGNIFNAGKALGLEADVAPRPQGDNNVTSIDVIQVRRFATGLDTLNGELPRADTAPRASFGDGVVNVGDVVQARRYASGLDGLTPVGGPGSGCRDTDDRFLLIENLQAYSFRRSVKMTEGRTDGSRLLVPIKLTPFGGEAGVGFTIEYDPVVLRDPQVELGDLASDGAVLTVNDRELGRISVIVDSVDQLTRVVRTGEIVRISFEMIPGMYGETKLAFTDSLASRNVSDVNGSSAPIWWFDFSVNLGDRNTKAPR